MFSLSGVTTRAVLFAIIPALLMMPALASRRSHSQAKPGKSKLLSKSQMIAAAKTLSRKAKREERAAMAKLEARKKAKAAEKAELAKLEAPKPANTDQKTSQKTEKLVTVMPEAEKPALAKSLVAENSAAKLKAVEAQARIETPAKEVTKPSRLSTPLKSTPAEKGVDLEAPIGLRNVSQVATREQMNASVAKALQPDSAAPASSVTDVIEVIEFDSPENRKLDDIYREDVKRPAVSTVPNVSKKRVDLTRMDSDRISQIQDALVRKNYLTGTPTGVYDSVTEEAMRRFQADHKVDVTGFPTAQSLKLLGLMDWR